MGVPLRYNIRNLVERKGTTLMTAVGIGLTVAVLVMALALTAGLAGVFASSGDIRQILVLRKGTDAELTSTVSSEAYQTIRQLPGIAMTAQGEPMVSPEALTVVNLPSVDSPGGMNVTVRGILPIGLSMRSFSIEQGKMIDPGLRQVVVGESIAKRYPNARIGGQLKFGRGMWEVVGVFKAGTSAANSEIWADLNQLRGDFERQGGSSSLLVRLNLSEAAAATENAAIRATEKAKADRESAAASGINPETLPPVPPYPTGALSQLTNAINDDQRLGSSVIGEKDYYAKLTEAGDPLKYLGFSIAIIMAIGSAFAATNTMYAAVARRSREIGTLRALGFGRAAILRSFMLESICLAMIGGALGVLVALPINGLTTAVGSFKTFSETAFKLNIGPASMLKGIAFSAIIGAVGGFLPAWSASKKSIIAAMRDI